MNVLDVIPLASRERFPLVVALRRKTIEREKWIFNIGLRVGSGDLANSPTPSDRPRHLHSV
jgi:hypothetical protein